MKIQLQSLEAKIQANHRHDAYLEPISIHVWKLLKADNPGSRESESKKTILIADRTSFSVYENTISKFEAKIPAKTIVTTHKNLYSCYNVVKLLKADSPENGQTWIPRLGVQETRGMYNCIKIFVVNKFFLTFTKI